MSRHATFKTRFLEITNRKEREIYYSDLRALKCFKKGLKKYVNKKVKSRNGGGSTNATQSHFVVEIRK